MREVPNACQCELCQSVCTYKPGWFLPDEIAPLAKAMGLTEQELFDRHLMVDYWAPSAETEHKPVFVLSPAITGCVVGHMFPPKPTGQCAWLKNGKCEVHKLGKPAECVAAHHDEAQELPLSHLDVALAWNIPEQQARIEALYGRPLVMPQPSWSDMLDLMFG